tara:strand:+ start:197 stop:799 length:603 start_codon:yes stop_codon:yes gene_type:complete
MKFLIKTMLMILIIPTSINAKEISYDFIDTGYYWQQSSFSTTTFEKWDGYYITLNKSLNENIYLLGGLGDVSKSNGDQVDYKGLGFGVHFAINDKTDIALEYEHLHYDFDYVSQTDVDGIYNITYVKILHQLSDDIEVTAGVGRADLAGRKILFIEPLVGARYKINDNFSLSFEIGNAKDSKVATSVDVEERRFGIRYNF